MKFDPLSLRTAFEKQRTLTSSFNEAYDRFAQTITCDSISVISNLSPNSRRMDVLLVHLFGLKGVESLKLAVKLIPKEVPQSERLCYIKNIVTSVLPDEITLTDYYVGILIKLLDGSPEYNINSTLRTLSDTTGTAYTDFLAPPTSSCLIQQCPRFGDPDSLYQHHPPTTVSVFTFEGPKPATKVCLKCRECNTIYNYNSFGKKKSEGERFYNNVREYVEVSDVAYCDHRLLQVYSLLRLVAVSL